ncbi:hypothetical protein [Marinimicrobium sp. ABcell2]|uniref:hypothetical protein n=1 Tax=Marinimicrobium sp. ABcell2 TaxID=3069751 RepID=UPI0027AF2438|nr:hypothetical protein [Marinimicrobium sp. ABcell2]MDQ2075126.1 hypothetical protein [Marinimicrobium sp. ABcell2]
MKAIAMKLFVLVFLASVTISANADEENNADDEKTPTISKINIASKNGVAENSSKGVVVSEANARNRGRPLEAGDTAAPINEKKHSDGQLLSE